MTSPQPTLAGFIAWVRSAMGVPVQAIADDSPYFGWAFDVSVATVNFALKRVPGPIYMLAVYNLAGDRLVNWAPDPSPPFDYPADPSVTPPTPYWQYLRTQYDINGFIAGVVQSSNDVTTGNTLLVPDFMKEFQLSDLQELKTPWGRAYLAWAQKYGTAWGLTR